MNSNPDDKSSLKQRDTSRAQADAAHVNHESSNFWGVLLFLLLMCSVTWFALTWPASLDTFKGIGAPPAKEYWGEVQSIRYVGGLSVKTQLTTQNRTFLLLGVVNTQIGDRLEKREYLTGVDPISRTPYCSYRRSPKCPNRIPPSRRIRRSFVSR